jgi:hypothetical protein
LIHFGEPGLGPILAGEEPDQRRRKAHHREEVPRELLVPRRDTSVPLQALEEVLDDVPPLVELPIESSASTARSVRGDDDPTALSVELCSQLVGIITLVGEHVRATDP